MIGVWGMIANVASDPATVGAMIGGGIGGAIGSAVASWKAIRGKWLGDISEALDKHEARCRCPHKDP